MNDNDDNQRQIPPGYRFFPTEEELVSFYLRNKLANVREEEMERVIPAVNLYYLDPWQLLEVSGEPCRTQDSEQWFFFCPRQEREAHGGKPARITPSGYWKATGSPSPVYSYTSQVAKLIGVKKSMVFYEGKAPRGTKTKWKMNEYRALDETVRGDPPKLRTEFSLCRVYKNSGCVRAFDRRPLMDAGTSAGDRSRLGFKRDRSQDFVSEDFNDDASSVASLEEYLEKDIELLQRIDWDDWL